MSRGKGCGIIWDVDGTLVDTAAMHFDAWEQTCRELDRPFTRADFTATFGLRNLEIFHHLFGERFSRKEIDALGDHKEELYRAATLKVGIEPLPGVRDLLGGLQREEAVQAIGSSAPRANLDMILRVTGLAGYFTAISSMEDTQRGKPDPQVFLVAAERIQVAPDRCVVLEDAVAGIQAARAGGMKSIAVTFVGHHPAEKLRDAGADMVVGNLSKVTAKEVLELLK